MATKKSKTKSTYVKRPGRARRLRRALREIYQFSQRLHKNVVPRLSNPEKLPIKVEAPDFSGVPKMVEGLREELKDWGQSLEKAGMGHVPKHEQVLDAYKALQPVSDAIEVVAISAGKIPSEVTTRNAESFTRTLKELDGAWAKANKLAAEVHFPGQFQFGGDEVHGASYTPPNGSRAQKKAAGKHQPPKKAKGRTRRSVRKDGQEKATEKPTEVAPAQ